jgi:hypothetical protein
MAEEFEIVEINTFENNDKVGIDIRNLQDTMSPEEE